MQPAATILIVKSGISNHAGRGTEELPGFYSKEFAAAGYIGTLWFPHFLSTAYLLYTFPVARAF